MNKKLSQSQIKFIKDNLNQVSVAEIARQLNCSYKTVDRYKKKILNEDFNLTEEKPEILEVDRNHWIQDIVNSARGRRLKNILNKDEWSTFCDEWASYHEQLEDLNHTEENSIEQIILLKLRIDKNQYDYSKAINLRDSLMQESGARDIKELDLTDPSQAAVYEKVFAASLRMTDLNKEYKDLLEKSTKLSESLNITRKQREEKGKVGADTFFSLCKKFDSKKTRNQEGRMAELLKISMDSKTNQLRNAIEFMDGEMAPQLLDSDTVKEMRLKNE
jgi:hypothetical protein